MRTEGVVVDILAHPTCRLWRKGNGIIPRGIDGGKRGDAMDLVIGFCQKFNTFLHDDDEIGAFGCRKFIKVNEHMDVIGHEDKTPNRNPASKIRG